MWPKSLALAALLGYANAAATFPNQIDEIEDLLFLQDGYRAKGFQSIVTPCSKEAYNGFNNAAGIIRTAFHDMAAHDAGSGTDGIDGSIGFELAGAYADKNAGPGFMADILYFTSFFNSKASIADLLSLGVVTAVKSCGGPDIALRAGRIDATSGGSTPALPDPAETADKLTGRFSKMGFSPQEMIQLVACGHTIGGVHKGVSSGFNPQDPGQVAAAGAAGQFDFDTSDTTFDNRVAQEYCSPGHQNSINQLVRDQNGRASDQKVFDVDKGSNEQYGPTIRSMAASNDAYNGQCQFILQKMINTVPSGVQLSDVIQAYDVKPVQVDLNVQPDGSIGVLAEIRVRDGAVGGVANIQLVYTGRDDDPCKGDCTIPMQSVAGRASGKGQSFTFYRFSGKVSSITSYKVAINGNLFDNNGESFPVSDDAFIQTASSTTNNGQLSVVVAVRGSGSAPSLSLVERSSYTFNRLPSLSTNTVSTNNVCRGSKWSFFKATMNVKDANSAKIDLIAGGQKVDEFRNALFGSSAAKFDCRDITSSTTTSSSTTSSAKSSSLTTTSTSSAKSSSTSSASSTKSSTSSTAKSSSSSSSSSTTSTEVSTTSSGPTPAPTSTDPEVVAAGNPFYVSFNGGSSSQRRLTRRALQYLGFDSNGNGILVDSEAAAAKLVTDDQGNLKTGGKYVILDDTNKDAPILTTSTDSSKAIKVSVSGGQVSFSGVSAFSVSKDGTLVAAAGANSLSVVCVSTDPKTTTTTTTKQTTTSSTSSSTSAEATTTSSDASSTTSDASSTSSGASTSTTSNDGSSTSSGSSVTSSGSSSGTAVSTGSGSTTSTGTESSQSTTKSGYLAWQAWTDASVTSTTAKPSITPEIIVPTKASDAEDAFNSAVASIVADLNKKPAKGINDVEQDVPGLDLNVPVPHVTPTITATTAVFTQTIVYVSWNSTPKPTGNGSPGSGQPGYGQPGYGNGQPGAGQSGASGWNSWASGAAQASAAPASSWATWAAPSATSTGTVKPYTGSASSVKAGSFVLGAAGILAAAVLL